MISPVGQHHFSEEFVEQRESTVESIWRIRTGLLEGRELKPSEGGFNYIRCSIFGANPPSVKVAVTIPHTCLCGRGMETSPFETRPPLMTAPS